MRVWTRVLKYAPGVFKLKHLVESPGEHVKAQTLDLPPRVSHSAGLGRDPSICISNKETLMLPGQGPRFENQGAE